MFGLVSANIKELSKTELARYNQVYCGICRRIRLQSSSLSRFGLSYDMAFLALLLLSLYEPEETTGKPACGLHPLHPRPWVDDPIIAYCADMNVALCYYKALDDCNDEGKVSAKMAINIFEPHMPRITACYPQQCNVIAQQLQQLTALEKEGCTNPDTVAACFGALMAELFVYQQDRWEPTLREMGMALGRFIYLADAAIDYHNDEKKKNYNPFLAMQTGENWAKWEEYLVLEMGRCTDYYQRLPLIRDKGILDNILYSGIWLTYSRKRREKRTDNG